MGGTGEATDVLVRCVACNTQRTMAEAFDRDTTLPPCRGRRPHLRDFEAGGCKSKARPRAILLGASNLWFPVSMSVLHVPHAAQNKLAKLIEDHPFILKAKSKAVLEFFRDEGKLGAFEGYSLDEIFAAIEERSKPGGGGDVPPMDLKAPEWEAFERCDPSQQNRDFELEEHQPPVGYEKWFSKIVLARRVREVTALVGFTRIGSPRDYANIADVPGDVRVSLARTPPHFVPASEVRGEGIYLWFREDRLARWCGQDEESARVCFLHGAHRMAAAEAHRTARGGLSEVALHPDSLVLARAHAPAVSRVWIFGGEPSRAHLRQRRRAERPPDGRSAHLHGSTGQRGDPWRSRPNGKA